MLISSRTASAVLALSVSLYLTSAARAVVETIDATVTAEIDQYFGSDILNSDRVFESYNETTSNLPLIAQASLRTLDSVGEELAGADATATFQDPRLSEGPNPGEFGLDVAAFGIEQDVSFAGRCDSTETREITFLASEIGESTGTSLTARSQFFLDGFMVIWGLAGDEHFANTQAQVHLSVDQTRPSGPQVPRVLEATILLQGLKNGNADVVIDGALQVDNVTVLNMSGQLSNFGPAFLVVIPEIGIPYDYLAAVDEQFVLNATISANVRNQPGTGAGVALGVPVEEFGRLIDSVSEDVVDGGAGNTMRVAVEAAPPAAKPLPRSNKIDVTVQRNGLDFLGLFPIPTCALMGVEPLLLMMILPFVWAGRPGPRLIRRARRLSPSQTTSIK